MKSFLKSFLNACMKYLAVAGRSELTKWGYNE